MLRRFRILLVFSCVFCMPAMIPEQETREYWYRKAKTAIEERVAVLGNKRERAKNVIFLVGDGMGVTTLTAARIFKGQREGKFGEDTELAWEKFPALALTKDKREIIFAFTRFCEGIVCPMRVGSPYFVACVCTYNLDAQVGESSACATALLCGVKSNFETVGLDGKGRFENCFSSFTSRVDSLVDWAQQEGKSTGIVTNTRITHATPAALYSHSSSRYWEDDSKVPTSSRKSCKDIARQLVEDDPGRHINVLLGGGRRHWLPKVSNDPESVHEEGRRLDGRNLIEDWLREKKKRGVKAEYVWKKSQLDQINPSKVDQLLGLFAYSHMEFETDRDKSDNGDPSLSEMAVKALSILSRNQKGYFLFVESGRIDHAHHFNNPFRALEETLVLESTLVSILSAVNLQETLIVLTSDHSHVLTLGGLTTPKGNNILGMDTKMSDVDNMPYSTLLYGNGPGFNVPRPVPTNLSIEEKNAVHGAAVPRKWATHGGEDVPVYAIGPLSSALFTGTVDQSYVPHAVAYAACLADFKQRCMINNEISNSSQTFQTNCVTSSDNSSGRSAVVLASSVLGKDESRQSDSSRTSPLSVILLIIHLFASSKKFYHCFL